MQHIDWAISATVFLIVLVTVLSVIPNHLPISTNHQEAKLNATQVYNNLTNDIDIYTIQNPQPTTNFAQPFVLEIDSNNFKTSNSYRIDENKIYGVVYNESTILSSNLLDLESTNNPQGVLKLSENFNDYNYLDTFDVNSGSCEISFNSLKLDKETIISTKEKYSDYNALINTDSEILNIYIDYTDENNTYICEIMSNEQNLVKVSSGSKTVIETSNIELSNNVNWRNINFGSTDTEVKCIIDNTLLNHTKTTDTNSYNILLESVSNDTYIDDFKIYNNSDIDVNLDSNIISTNSFDININNNSVNIEFKDSNYTDVVDLEFSGNLTLENTNNISILRDNNDNKLMIFPQTDEIWVELEEDEDINVSAKSILDYYIEQDDTDYNLWTKIDLEANSTKTIILEKVDGFTPNGDDIFIFFDDFDSQRSHWAVTDGNYSFDNGLLTIGMGVFSAQQFDFNLQNNYSVEVRSSAHTPNGFYGGTSPGIGSKPYTYHSSARIFVMTSTSGNSKRWWGGTGINSDYDIGGGYVSDMTPSEFYRYKIDLPENKIKISTDDVLNVDLNDITWAQDLTYLSLGYFTGPTTYDMPDINYDYVFVRKYTNNVPTVEVTEVGSKYVVQITNNESFDLEDFQVKLPNDVIGINSKTQSIRVSEHKEEKLFLSDNLNSFDTNCNVDTNNGITHISNCNKKTLIKIKSSTLNQDKVVINKTNEKIIMYDTINNLSNSESYYLNISSPTISKSVGSDKKIQTILYERFVKFLNNSGEIEIAKVLIKPYNN